MSENVSLNEKKSNGVVKFFVGFFMLLIAIAINVLVIGMGIFEFINSDMDTPVTLAIGVALSVVYALIIFVIPYLRRMGFVKSLAFLALGDAAWWIYLLIAA